VTTEVEIRETGEAIASAMISFMGEDKATPTPVRVATDDRIIERLCACGGSRAVVRPHWDGSNRTICLDCGNEVGRTSSGEIG
jgi:hypothetical protein